MNYGDFAYVYDFLMQDVPYDKWLEFFQKKANIYNAPGKKVMDLACGTGELSIRLAKLGYQVTGVDLSEDMLMVTSQKANKESVQLSLFQQNMSQLEGLGLYDVITVFCDSLNYLTSPHEVQESFKRIHDHLQVNGLFFFDIHSIYKMEHIFSNQTFTEIEDEVSYIWNCFEGENPYSVEHELTFFVLDEKTDQYSRFDELHKQRTYTEDDYHLWLNEAGFDVLEVSADFANEKPKEDSERIFFVCRKK
ncbi:class I SAM-dependent methyltransferase [Heyndrickxia sporothermodurans]|uniref:class I SAM-dependent DNA methyltransferase n=1 Tax=Heyndrickxia sporothermodurans TaxID=46224 RepID=UPI003D1FAEA5